MKTILDPNKIYENTYTGSRDTGKNWENESCDFWNEQGEICSEDERVAQLESLIEVE